MKFRRALTAFLLAAGLAFAVGCDGSDKPKPEGAKTGSAKPGEPAPPDAKRIAQDEALGIKFSPDKRTLVSYNGALPQTEYAIPNGVTAIGKKAFEKCSNLANVTIPPSVREIGEGAFVGCEKLTCVTIPSGVTTIAQGVFLACKSLKSVDIPAGMKNIGKLAFAGCEKLTCVTIPMGVKKIGDWAFDGCPCEAEVRKQFPNYR